MELLAAAELVKLSGKERDAESGLDYFGARYYGSALGRFTSPDPSMESVLLRNPQTGNRYVYSLNNPLRYIDPTGELWTAANGGYSWVDQCGDGQACYQAAAAVSGNNLVLYGSANARDITTYAANKNGYVDMSDVAGHADAHFEIKDGAASFLSLKNAAGFFNTAEQYHEDTRTTVIWRNRHGKLRRQQTSAARDTRFGPRCRHPVHRTGWQTDSIRYSRG